MQEKDEQQGVVMRMWHADTWKGMNPVRVGVDGRTFGSKEGDMEMLE